MQSAQFRPVGNMVLLRIDPRKDKIGNIVLPGNKTGVELVGYSTAHVVAAGPGAFERRPEAGMQDGAWFRPDQELHPGDRVLIRDYHQDLNPIEMDDEGMFAVIHFADLVAVLDESVKVGQWSQIGSIS